jgi:hypothetical protein
MEQPSEREKPMINHLALAEGIHGDNRRAGWWTDINTGEKLNRNFGEIIALAHSELSECYEGFLQDWSDDHLPEFPMYQVEIADACIRVYDALGGFFSDYPYDVTVAPADARYIVEDLLLLHMLLSKALEAFRKSRMDECRVNLVLFVAQAFKIAEAMEFNLLAIIEAKREYNRNRADHKIENRLKEDGKKI